MRYQIPALRHLKSAHVIVALSLILSPSSSLAQESERIDIICDFLNGEHNNPEKSIDNIPKKIGISIKNNVPLVFISASDAPFEISQKRTLVTDSSIDISLVNENTDYTILSWHVDRYKGLLTFIEPDSEDGFTGNYKCERGMWKRAQKKF